LDEIVGGRRLGLVVGGTGVRGFAQAGVLAGLERAGLSPDVVVGVSTGAIVAAAYAAREDWSQALQGMDRSKLPALVQGPEGEDSLTRLRTSLRNVRQLAPSMWTWGRQGYAEYGRVALLDLLGEEMRLDQARVPTALVATDLQSGQRAVLDSGGLVTAALAASVLPGVARPVEIAGRHLVDGAFSDPVPTDVARELGADVVMAVHAGAMPGEDPDSWVLALVRGMEIGQHAFTEERLADADVVVRADLGTGVRSLDFQGVDEAARRLAAAVAQSVPRIREALDAP
jgi:NTE family protein